VGELASASAKTGKGWAMSMVELTMTKYPMSKGPRRLGSRKDSANGQEIEVAHAQLTRIPVCQIMRAAVEFTLMALHTAKYKF